MKRTENSLWETIWDNVKCTNIWIIGVPEEEEKKKGYEKILNEILARYSNLVCRFSPFGTLNISCHSLLACRVSAERSTVKSMGFPLYVTCCFSLASFSYLSLCSVFVSLISMFFGMFLLGFILYGPLCASWTWLTISFSILGKISTIISSKIFSYPLKQ